MRKENSYYVPGFSATIILRLRRSVQGSVRYSAMMPCKDAKFLNQKTQSEHSNFLCVFAQTLRLCVKPFIILFTILSISQTSFSQTWIWYPGDYEIWLANQMQNRRTDRGTFFPVFWKVDNHYPLMDFHKIVDLKEQEEISIYAEGQYNIKLDGKPFEGTPAKITVPAGKHKINIKVFCQQAVPSVYVKGKTIMSDGTWLTTFEDKEWIDETGKTSDI